MVLLIDIRITKNGTNQNIKTNGLWQCQLRIVGKNKRGRAEGHIVEVMDETAIDLVGQYFKRRGNWIVIPDNPKITHKIIVNDDITNKATEGSIVVIRIISRPDQFRPSKGKIIEVIGDRNEKGIDTRIAIHSNNIPVSWPKAVNNQLANLQKEVSFSSESNRIDLRDLDFITIDGVGARDFDDAVYAKESKHGFRLLVAIADVAHYVEIDSPLDKEALNRGTSVYFPDRVIPMLPKVLSNDLCSLNPDVDRFCMVCEMDVDLDGNVTKSKFFNGIMRSKARLTYSQVNSYLNKENVDFSDRGIERNIKSLYTLFKIFLARRKQRGAIEFDIPQTSLELDSSGFVKSIRSIVRNDAHKLIEECMIAANVEAAKFILKHKVAGLYRIHSKPDPDRFSLIRSYLISLGLRVPNPRNINPGDFARMTELISNRPDAPAISMTLLRTMAHAEYSPENIGHFGLALKNYAHFTSPIRRYPDLLIHRAIKHIIDNQPAANNFYKIPQMKVIGKRCSQNEKRAEEAVREVEATLKCRYMKSCIGQNFNGIIINITTFGAFVQIPEIQVEGLLHVTKLTDDYYNFDSESYSLVGERSGQRYTLGDVIKVSVSNIDMDSRQINFDVVI